MQEQDLFIWKQQIEAEKFILDVVSKYQEANTRIALFSSDLSRMTGTRLLDWVDYISITETGRIMTRLESLGFQQEFTHQKYRVYTHFGTHLPSIVICNDETTIPLGVAVRVDRIADFLMVRGISAPIEGSPFSGLRRCILFRDKNSALTVVERRGVRTMDPQSTPSDYMEAYFDATQTWLTRARHGDDEALLVDQTHKLAGKLAVSLGKDLAAHIIFECERRYWQSRNFAGQIQKERQDRLGMGWANHDHHTFRSSRAYFSSLVQLMQTLGFKARERYYAGKEAGWGAQVMENPNCRITLFLDVDLSPDELDIDFTSKSLSELDQLGTVGLWCALHGQSLLSAGIHHLAVRSLFQQTIEQLKRYTVETMAPFSFFEYLKQAFTKGEFFRVDPQRLEKLQNLEKISDTSQQKFLKSGALGSHMEIIERNEGFKGFNQKNVSMIISKTDPRSN